MAFKELVEGILLKQVVEHINLKEPQIQSMIQSVVMENLNIEESANEVIVAELEDLDIAEAAENAINNAHPSLEDDVTELVHEKIQTMVDDLVESIDLSQIVKDAVEAKLARALEAIKQDS